MYFVAPVGMRQLKHIIDELEQISHSISLKIARKLVLKVVVPFLLLHNVADDTFEIFPWIPHIYFAQLFHPLIKLYTLDEGLHNFVILW